MSKDTPRITSGIMIGVRSSVFSVFLPGKSYLTKAMAAGMPTLILMMDVTKPSKSEVLKAEMIGPLWANLMYHLKLTPFMGKLPNISGLNERMITTTTGANMEM
jgi:hypothetical protein